ncbi:uncharacterized protein NDAI_0F02710 [Naumovozyma dairenensis CBS 421]|uniref:Transcription factor TFIIIC triple barrel domain-containing protein n=1 Tax=Naumovozyma dairenensis (strain ATCC 10597 / BCRC 20456 / CBS 421 / NBRC 0211 / NRRL Y-12639) TaxID=1071378 RepID=G0WCS8_NAUDC|nr:hypothetical protein NDAI_0F02710 [Naumovozyma dairenensis CBS 421]CCD25589.1 hypothetical protein NDAI_0F02710 [Naumovozyma dairenensis CBS 421]
MAIKVIYVARHGYRSNWVLKGPYPDPPTGIENDVPLAQHGLDQAKELGEYMKTKIDPSLKPQLIISSPFYRCLQTAQPTKMALDLPLCVDRGLGEWFRVERATIPYPADVGTLKELFPGLISDDTDADDGWENCSMPSRHGETEEDIFNRCKEFLSNFFMEAEKKFPDVERVMFFTHAATKAALGMNLLGFSSVRDTLDDSGKILNNPSCSLDKYEATGAGWKITMNGNTSYLSKGAEMNWSFQKGFREASDEDIKIRLAADAAIAAEKGAKVAATMAD